MRCTRGHFLRFLRFLRSNLGVKIPIAVGGWIGPKIPLHEARVEQRRLPPSASLNSIQRLFDKLLTAKWGEKPLYPQESCTSPSESESRVYKLPQAAAQKA